MTLIWRSECSGAGGQFDDSASGHILVDPAEHQIARTLSADLDGGPPLNPNSDKGAESVNTVASAPDTADGPYFNLQYCSDHCFSFWTPVEKLCVTIYPLDLKKAALLAFR